MLPLGSRERKLQYVERHKVAQELSAAVNGLCRDVNITRRTLTRPLYLPATDAIVLLTNTLGSNRHSRGCAATSPTILLAGWRSTLQARATGLLGTMHA